VACYLSETRRNRWA